MPGPLATPQPPAPALELVDVSARYDAARGEAVRGVTLTVVRGELLAVVGPNGAGKSTLLRLMVGTLLPAGGLVRLAGAPLAGIERRAVAREVAFVTQSEEVRFSFSVRDIVMMGRAPHQLGSLRASADDVRAVDEALRACDLEPLAGRPVDELSGGERKRVAIARAFAQAAPVMLLDEPTAFLDVRHQVSLFERLGGRVRAGELTCVVVTHDLQLAAAHATRVAILKAGRLLVVGAPDDVLTGPRLGEAFDCPIDAGRLEGTSSRVFVPRGRLSPGPSPGAAG